jgi:hypothetical protein
MLSAKFGGVKMISTGRSNYPEILKKIWLPILELLPLFHQIFKIHFHIGFNVNLYPAVVAILDF